MLTCSVQCILKEDQAVEEDPASTQVVECEEVTLLHDIFALLEEDRKHLFNVGIGKSDISVD